MDHLLHLVILLCWSASCLYCLIQESQKILILELFLFPTPSEYSFDFCLNCQILNSSESVFSEQPFADEQKPQDHVAHVIKSCNGTELILAHFK